MKVICNKAGECENDNCKHRKEHEYVTYCDSRCTRVTDAKCIPFESYKPQAKPRRVRAFKEDVVAENTLLKMRVHQLECECKELLGKVIGEQQNLASMTAVKELYRGMYESVTVMKLIKRRIRSVFAGGEK